MSSYPLSMCIKVSTVWVVFYLTIPQFNPGNGAPAESKSLKILAKKYFAVKTQVKIIHSQVLNITYLGLVHGSNDEWVAAIVKAGKVVDEHVFVTFTADFIGSSSLQHWFVENPKVKRQPILSVALTSSDIFYIEQGKGVFRLPIDLSSSEGNAKQLSDRRTFNARALTYNKYNNVLYIMRDASIYYRFLNDQSQWKKLQEKNKSISLKYNSALQPALMRFSSASHLWVAFPYGFASIIVDHLANGTVLGYHRPYIGQPDFMSYEDGEITKALFTPMNSFVVSEHFLLATTASADDGHALRVIDLKNGQVQSACTHRQRLKEDGNARTCSLQDSKVHTIIEKGGYHFVVLSAKGGAVKVATLSHRMPDTGGSELTLLIVGIVALTLVTVTSLIVAIFNKQLQECMASPAYEAECPSSVIFLMRPFALCCSKKFKLFRAEDKSSAVESEETDSMPFQRQAPSPSNPRESALFRSAVSVKAFADKLQELSRYDSFELKRTRRPSPIHAASKCKRSWTKISGRISMRKSSLRRHSKIAPMDYGI